MVDPPSQATITEERDQLLAEKEAREKPSEVFPEAKAVQENWDSCNRVV
jgi:hypothetical protein